jgi:GNAT superfamily N-acetyltransferase
VATGESGHGFKAHVTYLEMTHAPARTEPMPRGLNLSLLHAPEMSLAFYRFLQREVGDPWNWVNRRRLDDEQLSEIIHADTTELSVLYYNGSPAGFFEIDRAKPERPDIAFFGLMPRATGLKLGRWFLSQAIEAAWSEGEPNAITVQTCTADHPAALPLYQKLGFSPVGTDEEMIYPLKTHERMI